MQMVARVVGSSRSGHGLEAIEHRLSIELRVEWKTRRNATKVWHVEGVHAVFPRKEILLHINAAQFGMAEGG